jgi:hypothetical protein
MNASAAIALVLAVAVVMANLPFVNERIAVVGPRATGRKHWLVRLLELFVGCGLTLGLGMALESRMGQVHAQGWEFYAAMAFLFLTLAFPGFVWRYLRRQRG